MTDYTELVKALRCCSKDKCGQCEYEWNHNREFCMNSMCADAAAAIEALQAEVERYVRLNTDLLKCNDELRDKQTFIDHYGAEWMTSAKDVPTAAYEHGYVDGWDEAEAQLPKRGEWIKHPEVKNIYGGVYIECPFCGEKYVVQYVSDEKFCRNCGADLRAKTEVQK